MAALDELRDRFVRRSRMRGEHLRQLHDQLCRPGNAHALAEVVDVADDLQMASLFGHSVIADFATLLRGLVLYGIDGAAIAGLSLTLANIIDDELGHQPRDRGKGCPPSSRD